MPLSDEDLLRQVASGGKEAFIALYDRYAPRVFGLLIKLIPDRVEAEDVLQEVMWEIWRKAERYDPAIGSAQTWILLTARSRAIDALRRLRRAGELTSAVARTREEFQTPEASPSDRLSPPLSNAMSELPVEQQTAIQLAFIQGMTRQQIAEATGVPVGTVKTRISLGIRKLSQTARTGGSEVEA